MSNTNKFYTVVVRTLFRNMPDSVYTDDHIVFNDLDMMNEYVDIINSRNPVAIKIIRTEESVFKKNMLSCKRVITDYLKLEKQELEDDYSWVVAA